LKFVFGFLDFVQFAAFWLFVRNPAVFVQVVDALEPTIAKYTHIRVCPSKSTLENSEVMLPASAMSYSQDVFVKHIDEHQ